MVHTITLSESSHSAPSVPSDETSSGASVEENELQVYESSSCYIDDVIVRAYVLWVGLILTRTEV